MITLDQTEFVAQETSSNRFWLFSILLFLIIDYGRPQSSVAFISYLHLGLVTTFLLTIFLIRHRSFIPRNIIQMRLIWIFILILALHIPFSFNHRFAFNTTIMILLIMPFILSCMACVTSIADFKKVLIAAICLMVYQAQYAILHAGHGTSGILCDENDLALFLNSWLPFSYAFFLSTRGIWKRLFYGASTLIGMAAVVVTFSRGGFLGLTAMLAINLIFSTRKILTIGVLVLAAATVLVVSGLSSERKIAHQKRGTYWNELATTTNTQDGTARERIESWGAGWKMFLANPLGVGGNNYQVLFPDYQDNIYFKRGMWGRPAHSLWFTLIPETGIPGVIIYGLLMFFNIKATLLLRKNASYLPEDDASFLKNISVAFLASFTGFFVSATFLSVLYYPHYWYIAGLVITATLILKRSTTPVPEGNLIDVV
jgi:hypothetical protein